MYGGSALGRQIPFAFAPRGEKGENRCFYFSALERKPRLISCVCLPTGSFSSLPAPASHTVVVAAIACCLFICSGLVLCYFLTNFSLKPHSTDILHRSKSVFLTLLIPLGAVSTQLILPKLSRTFAVGWCSRGALEQSRPSGVCMVPSQPTTVRGLPSSLSETHECPLSVCFKEFDLTLKCLCDSFLCHTEPDGCLPGAGCPSA